MPESTKVMNRPVPCPRCDALEAALYRLAEWECALWLYGSYRGEHEFMLPYRHACAYSDMQNQWDRDDWYDLILAAEEQRIWGRNAPERG